MIRSLLLLLCLNLATAHGDAGAEVRAARLAQNAAIAARDLNRIAAYWTDNVIIQRGLGAQAIGKAAYLDLFRNDGADAVVFERFPDTVEVSPEWPLAFETGHWEGRLNGRAIIRGKYSAQWVKRGSEWLIRGEVYVALQDLSPRKDQHAVP